MGLELASLENPILRNLAQPCLSGNVPTAEPFELLFALAQAETAALRRS